MLTITREELYNWTVRCMWFMALLPVVIMLVVAALVAINWARQSVRQRLARRQAMREKVSPDGRPYPPRGRGVCQNCDKVSNVLYHLGNGQRLCRPCYLESTNGHQAKPD